MNLSKSFKQISAILGAFKKTGIIRGYALVGGFAISVWGKPRATGDIDFLVSLEPESSPSVLCSAFQKKHISAEIRKGVLFDPISCLISARVGAVPVDIILTSKKWEDEAVDAAVHIEFHDIVIPVLAPEYLVVMKLKAGGAQDILDAQNVLQLASVDEQLLSKLARRLHVDRLLSKVHTLR